MASPSLHAATRRGNVAILCETLVSCNPPDSRHAEPSRTQASPNIAPFHPWNRAEESSLSLSLSGSKLFTTAAVYARLDIYLQRERNGAAVSETAEQPSGNKEAVGDELYPKNRGALCASSRYSCFLGSRAGKRDCYSVSFFLSHIFLFHPPCKTTSRALTRCSSIVELV